LKTSFDLTIGTTEGTKQLKLIAIEDLPFETSLQLKLGLYKSAVYKSVPLTPK